MGLQVGTALHDVALVFAVHLVEAVEYHQEQRRGQQGNQCQLPRVDEHQAYGKHQYHDVDQQVERYVVDEVADFYGIVHARDDFAHPHGVEELLGQCQQVLVIAQYQRRINPLSGFQGKDAFHGADERAQQQQDEHDDPHEVEQVQVSVHQYIVGDFPDVNGSG